MKQLDLISVFSCSTSDPAKVLLVKGNQPLEVRYNAERGLVIYASEPEILDAAIGNDTGWEVIEIPAWHIVVVDTRRVIPLEAYPISNRCDEVGRPRPCR